MPMRACSTTFRSDFALNNFALPIGSASYNHEVVSGTGILIASGRALYGDRWHTPVARDLGTTYRTVRNWLDGRHPVPPDLEARLRYRLIARGIEIDALLQSIGTDEEERGGA